MAIFGRRLLKENEALKAEVSRLKGVMKVIYDDNLTGYARHILIAGKTEGFNFKDADFYVVDNEEELREMQWRLRNMGYAVVLTAAIIDRDDILRN